MKIGILSDAHGNGPALGKALQVLSDVGAQEFFFLGDSLGYIPSVSALEILTNAEKEVVKLRGNHEQMLLSSKSGTERDEIYLHDEILPLVRPFRSIIEKWPDSLRTRWESLDVLMVHGSPADPLFGYVYPDTDLSAEVSSFDFVFMGNTHRPFMRSVGRTTYVNVGSCGMPRDDGRFGAAVLFDTDSRQAEILRFNIESETEVILERHPNVHVSVVKTFDRRTSRIEGRVLT